MTKTITFEEQVCCICGTTWHMESELDEFRHKDGGSFYCPNGHGQHYTTSQSKQLEDAKKELEETKVSNRQLKCALLREPPPPPPSPKPTLLKRAAALFKL